MAKLRLIIGTSNAHKVREISEILAPLQGVQVVPFSDECDELPEIEEVGSTFSEIAGAKAQLYARYLFARRGASISGRHTSVSDDTDSIEKTSAERARQRARAALTPDPPAYAGSRRVLADSNRVKPSDIRVLADDSGLVVDALGGAPGIRSARYAGAHGDDLRNNQKVLREMEEVADKKRTARFVCAIALATQHHVLFTVEGKVDGTIAREAQGDQGFGYDPIFYYPPYQMTFGEAKPEAKNAVSHRANALKLLKSRLMRLMQDEGMA